MWSNKYKPHWASKANLSAPQANINQFSKFLRVMSCTCKGLQELMIITINVQLFKKLRDIIFFFAGQSLYEPFQGTFWGGQDFFDPLNCPERSEGQFRGQKSRGPLKMSREMAHKAIVQQKKN